MADEVASTYIGMLYRINSIFQHNKLGYEDFIKDINYYSENVKGGTYSKELLNEIINRCITEWKILLLKICDDLTKRAESRNEYKLSLNKELKKIKNIHKRVTIESLLPDDYEEIYEEHIIKIKDEIEKIINDKDFDKKLFKKSLIYGIIISIVTGIITGLVTGYYLFKWGLA